MGGGEEMFRLTSYIYSLYIVRVHGWRGGDVSVNVVHIQPVYSEGAWVEGRRCFG